MVDRIKTLCKEKGLNLYRLEMALGFANGTIKRWDTNVPSVDRLAAVASYLGVTMEYLLYDDQPYQSLYENLLVHGGEKQPSSTEGLSEIALKVAQIVNRFPPESQELVLHRIQSLEQALQALDDVPKSE